MHKTNLEEYEIINGKPHGGILFGRSVIINNEDIPEELDLKDPVMSWAYESLKDLRIENGLELRHETIVYRKPYLYGGLYLNASLAYKFMVWGRAFKVQKMIKKGTKRTKKVRRGGKMKRVKL